MVAMGKIQEFANQIARQFRPHQIVLFGSHATGAVNVDSDVDLLVVISHAGKNWRMATKIREAVKASFPLDLLVRRPDEMKRRVAACDVLLRSVQESGEILYEAPHE
jgi:uncharacterized protein